MSENELISRIIKEYNQQSTFKKNYVEMVGFPHKNGTSGFHMKEKNIKLGDYSNGAISEIVEEFINDEKTHLIEKIENSAPPEAKKSEDIQKLNPIYLKTEVGNGVLWISKDVANFWEEKKFWKNTQPPDFSVMPDKKNKIIIFDKNLITWKYVRPPKRWKGSDDNKHILFYTYLDHGEHKDMDKIIMRTYNNAFITSEKRNIISSCKLIKIIKIID